MKLINNETNWNLLVLFFIVIIFSIWIVPFSSLTVPIPLYIYLNTTSKSSCLLVACYYKLFLQISYLFINHCLSSKHYFPDHISVFIPHGSACMHNKIAAYFKTKTSSKLRFSLQRVLVFTKVTTQISLHY